MNSDSVATSACNIVLARYASPGNRRGLPGKQVGLLLRGRKQDAAPGGAGRIDRLESRLVRRCFGEQPGKTAPTHGRICVGCFVLRQRPAHFAQGHRLTNQPGARPGPWILVPPMFWLGHRLPVEFKGQFGMTGPE